MNPPAVSVIVPVYNTMPWLTECIESVLAQTIGPDRLEVIGVDDCSTDGSGAELDRFASADPRVRVIHLPENSGGAGKPCNVGMNNARGEYVFFLGADDYLGPEALERMVDMARSAGSDIVLGKTAPAPGFGRRGHRKIWTRNQPRADLFTSHIYESLGQIKLFRRAFLEQSGLRFETGRRLASDQPFVAAAYLAADVISVVADYDCYYIRDRGDGSNVTAKPDDPLAFIDHIDNLARMVADHVPPGPKRDHLMIRHVRNEILRWVVERCWLDEMPDDDRAELAARANRFLDRWMTDRIFGKLPPARRVMAYCLQHGKLDELTEVVQHQVHGTPRKAVLDGDRAYADLPLFRDPEAGIPDHCYELTSKLRVVPYLRQLDWDGTTLRIAGTAYIRHLDADEQTVSVILRERSRGTEHHVTAATEAVPEPTGDDRDNLYDMARAGFRADLDLARIARGGPLPPGRWDVYVSVRAHGITRERRLGAERAGGLAPARHVLSTDENGQRPFSTYFTERGNLTLHVARRDGRQTALERLLDKLPVSSSRAQLRRARRLVARLQRS